MLTVKYVLGTGTDPYVNLAFEEALTGICERDELILYLWQNDNTIVIGRNQDLYSECRAREFIQQGGRIARRKSGGGAVYHDIGNLNFSLIGDAPTVKNFDYSDMIAGVLRDFDVDISFNGRNDLLAGGAKFSGSAEYISGGIACKHGTVLVSTDIEKMDRFLTPEAGKLARNGVSSVRARVTNLSSLSEKITVGSFCDGLLAETKALLLDRIPDRAVVENLQKKYRSEEWLYGRSWI